ncbi:zinc-binding dehydrogenase [Catellatospora tritici]|uniref:zinc-binding dehydrogenase n=1 Tax=Catellatospora tritici TaxID=2851566 RepID=UPI001C2D0D0A|nr:zinc-binding dehydrogenase [Catellatospora tritici]MBV1853044.1 zinc-binding dehydrogenase [Catellatospora tritici]
MRAIRQYEFGPAENLLFEQVPDPRPGDGQVVVQVEAAGVHLIDTSIRGGGRTPFPLPSLPMTPGREVAGRVVETGPGVDPSRLGRRVVAHLGLTSGGYAERAVAAATALHEIPDHLSAQTAVAMIGTGRTAVGVLDRAAPTGADAVLVTAAAGGLGTLFVQAAQRAGAYVVGVAGGPAKVEQVLRNGADAALDYTEAGWPERVRAALGEQRLTLVIDGVGGQAGRAALELLAPGGRFVICGWSSGTATEITTADLYTRGITASSALGPGMVRPLRDLEEQALREAAEGWFTPLVTEFKLADAAAAHRALESRATVGKVVLLP